MYAFLYILALVAQSCPALYDPWTIARQATLSMGFSRQDYWSGLPFSFPFYILKKYLFLSAVWFSERWQLKIRKPKFTKIIQNL